MPLPFDPAELQYRPFSADCAGGAFSCGQEVVDRWFHEKSDKHHRDHCSLTVIFAPEDPEPVGFYALCLSISDLNRKLLPAFLGTDKFPSLHLDWLAVRGDLQGNGLGTILMGRVLDKFQKVIELTRVPALTLTPLNQRTHAFYEGMGFVDLNPRRNLHKMVLPARDVFDVAGDEQAAGTAP